MRSIGCSDPWRETRPRSCESRLSHGWHHVSKPGHATARPGLDMCQPPTVGRQSCLQVPGAFHPQPLDWGLAGAEEGPSLGTRAKNVHLGAG